MLLTRRNRLGPRYEYKPTSILNSSEEATCSSVPINVDRWRYYKPKVYNGDQQKPEYAVDHKGTNLTLYVVACVFIYVRSTMHRTVQRSSCRTSTWMRIRGTPPPLPPHLRLPLQASRSLWYVLPCKDSGKYHVRTVDWLARKPILYSPPSLSIHYTRHERWIQSIATARWRCELANCSVLLSASRWS